MQVEGDICIMPQTKWNSIKNWLTDKLQQEEKRKREEAYMKHLKQMSSDLVAGHASKKEAAAKRIEEKRKQSEVANQKILKDYLKIKENQRKERDEIMKKYDKMSILDKSPTLELTSALREAQVLSERQNEVELRRILKKKEKELEEREKYELKRQWELINTLHRREEENRRFKLDATKSEVWKQCQDNHRRKNEEYTNQVKQEKMDILRMTEELNRKEKFKKEQEKLNRKKTLALMKKAAEEAQQQRYIKKKEDRELYRVNEVINNALTVRNCHIKSKLKEEVKERVEQNVDLYVKYVSQLPPTEPSEDIIYQNGVRETQDIYDKKMAEKRAIKKKYAEAKIQDYEEDMMRQKIKQEEEAELKRMEMIERYKKIEAMKYLDDINQKEEIEQKKKYAVELLNQAEEQKNIKEYKKKLEDEYVLYTYTKQDDGFAEYADEVIKFAKEKKWPTMPIRKVIENYKKTQPIIQRRRKEIPIGKQRALLNFQDEYVNLSPEEKKQFTNLDTELKRNSK